MATNPTPTNLQREDMNKYKSDCKCKREVYLTNSNTNLPSFCPNCETLCWLTKESK